MDPNFESPQVDSDSDDSFLPTCKKKKITHAIIRQKKLVDSQSVQYNNNSQPLTPLVEILPSTPTASNVIVTPPSRKRKRRPQKWKRNIRKTARQKGEEYENQNGKVYCAKQVKELSSCTENCTYKCTMKFTLSDRQNIHQHFWKLDDKCKNHFYAKFIKQVEVKRRNSKAVKSRKFSYQYTFQNSSDVVRVCQNFFLKTLDISERRVYWFFKNKIDLTTGVPKSPIKGRHIKQSTSNEKEHEVRSHIESFPRVPSHYCRQNSQKEYLDTSLNVRKMYSLYKENCSGVPVKENIYRKIFNGNFNLSFHVPKKDQCDLCVEFKNKTTMTAEEKSKIDVHIFNKGLAKAERDIDRKNKDEHTAIICYDLQNVISLPRAEISNFFYKRKFAVYNLTAHCNLNKKTYCSIWTENQSGRSGNDIASALRKILDKVVSDCPKVAKIIMWSDSCIPQNKNRVNSTMILKFLETTKHINSIHHKYSEPGHSQIQEIDSVHSAIERHLKGLTIFSPVSLIKLLLKMNYPNVHLQIMQMHDTDFYNYSNAAIGLNMIPFQKARYIKYERNDLNLIHFKCNLDQEEIFTSVSLIAPKCRSNKQSTRSTNIPEIKQYKFMGSISDEKNNDLIFEISKKSSNRKA